MAQVKKMENKLFDIIVLWAGLCCVNSFVFGNEIGIKSAIALLVLSAVSYCVMRYVSYRLAVKAAADEVIAEVKKRRGATKRKERA